jgi:pimeloyl-ACP methyl ester carboxylesterase
MSTVTSSAAVPGRALRANVGDAPTIHRPPPRALQLLELRAFGEFWAALALLPLLRRAPRGDGHPVLVLPGLIAGDGSTRLLRAYLGDRGYQAHGWGLGRNRGLRPGIEDRMKALVRRLHASTGRKVSLVGWSLGGVYARHLAHQLPDAVRSCIMLGAPIHGHPRSTNAWRLYERASGQSVDDPTLPRLAARPPQVPTTAIYSRTDGIVAWQCSVEQRTASSESIEVSGSHCGLGANASVLYAIADRLAQPEGRWQPFDRAGLRAFIFPDPGRSCR